MSTLQRFPAEIAVRHGVHMVRYRLDGNQRARPDDGARSHAEGEVPGYALSSDAVAVESDRPVYRREPGGEPAVATGRVYLRARSADAVERLRGVVDALGFTVADVPAHAPQTCWLEPLPGRLAEALAGWPRLLELPGVEHAEPQLLRAAPRRRG